MTRTGTARTRVLIVEDHVLFAESLDLALSMEGCDVRRMEISSTTTPGNLLTTVERFKPRVVLLDLDLGPLGNGVRVINPLARTGTNVVVVTASPDRARWGECIRHGARKVMSKTQPLNEIIGVVRRLNQGLPVLNLEERERLLALWSRQREEHEGLHERLERLTTREREVLGHLMAGRTVREIARVSVVSEATVRTQVKSILAKLEVSSQLAAVGLAHQVAWRPPTTERS